MEIVLLFDIIIVGGGIAGISAAARLSNYSSVLLLEREHQLGYHASGRSAASCIKDYGNDTTRDLNAQSFEYLRNENNGVLSDRGLMVLAKRDQRDEFETSSESLGLTEITLSEALTAVPIINSKTVAYASYREDVYDLDTNQLIQNFEREAKRNNAQIRNNTAVVKIERSHSKWRVITDSGEYHSSILVNAAGAWVDHISNLAGIEKIGFLPMRRSMARIPLPSEFEVADWAFFSGPREDWYAKPDAGQLIVSPAEEDLVEPHDAWAEDLILAEGISRYQEFVTTSVNKITSNWAGLRTFAPDRSLVIGPSKTNSSFFFLAGQGGYGFQTAPTASDLLKELIMGLPHDLEAKTIEKLDPKRFS